ncbi:MAG: YfhO family protein, partial [Endomicrobiaceae bacterium]|nr:YfhO family protein [Endomicrobiaceae bacterium]
KEKTFSILFDKDFDFLQTVVLDKEPKYKPVNQGISTINILSLNDNKIEIECKTTEPAIILVSSNYEKGWKAYNLDNKDIKYEIIQANYIYRAISVDKGVHRIRFEYKPLSFLIGSWISVFSWVLLIITAISLYCKRKYIKLK